MDVITAIIYIVLFIVLMIFVFSMGLLTPIIGKKDILSVLAIGFIVGIVGGTFFVVPVYQEMPYVVGSINEFISGDNETINIEISPIVDYNKLMSTLNKTEGVLLVENKGVVLTTDPFSDWRKSVIEEKIPIVDKDFKNFSVNQTGTIIINFSDNHNPYDGIKTLGDWLMLTAGINIRYSLIHIQITTKTSNANSVIDYLHSENIVITSVEGPIENSINGTQSIMLDNNLAILVSGLFGLFIAYISIYIDEIRPKIKEIIEKIKNI